MKLRAAFASIATAAALAGATASPAGAVDPLTATDRDSTQDVRHARIDRVTHQARTGVADTQVYRARARRDGDIAWTKLTNGGENVRLRVYFVDLRRIPKRLGFAVLVESQVSGQSGVSVTGVLETKAANWQGDVVRSDHGGLGLDPRVTWRIDYDTNDLYLNIPQSVTKRPVSARAAFHAETRIILNRTYAEQWYDDAMTGYQRNLSPRQVFGSLS